MESFESFEAMFDSMTRDEDAANKRVTPEQRDIGYGDYFIRIWDAGRMFGDPPLIVYGHVTPRDKWIADERDAGADDAELSWSMQAHDSAYQRGYRFGWHYSEVEPDGELGSTHVSVMARKISREEFDAARERGWKDKT
jgi:hypothetical protein